MIIAITCVIAIAVLAFVLRVRPQDLPVPEPVSPFAHLDERKIAIYENLRDLQFEYRLGKLSDEDYQSTKKDLQKELAAVLAAVDQLKAELQVEAKPTARTKGKASAAPPAVPASAAHAANGATAPRPQPVASVCPACGATFEKELKFCGECGQSMKVQQ